MKVLKWLAWLGLGSVALLIGSAFIGVLMNVSGGTDYIREQQATRARIVASAAAEPPTPVPTTLVPTARPTVLPRVGRQLVVDGIRVKVTDARLVGTTIASSNPLVPNLSTSGQFLRVRIELENGTKELRELGTVEIQDARGRVFTQGIPTVENAYVPGLEACGHTVTLQPDVPRACTLLFEVSADARGLKARFMPGRVFTTAQPVEVDLGL